MEDKSLSFAQRLAVLCAVIFVRVLVGYQPHSGQDNYHGSKVAYGGDFEAQRHWMEITVNLPVGEWYYYDLDYWGLDYPPLSAYQSWICGKLSQLLVGPESVALDTSRGIEDATHKAFMRGSVLLFDMILYGSAAWIFTRPQASTQPHSVPSFLLVYLRVMFQPSILLIDHGHFQYNTAALGLAMWSFFCFTRKPHLESMTWPIIGSIFFSCALSFKQMTLYYAPAIFAYLLGRCFQHGLARRIMIHRFVLLGLTVIATFVAAWWPFVVYGPNDTSVTSRLRHVLRRIFPFQRGLFEGKVSNIWCALSVQPFRIRQRIRADFQPLAALVLTLAMILPACIKLFFVGQMKKHPQEQSTRKNTHSVAWAKLHRRHLLWGVTNTSLAFFLASFQVHEKSLLMAVTPISLLATTTSSGSIGFGDWFAFVATWTMWPLLVLDRLQVAYWCIMLMFGAFLVAVRDYRSTIQPEQKRESQQNGEDNGIFKQHWLLSWIPSLSAFLLLGLHAAEAVVDPPAAMTDLFPVLWSIAGCGLCLFAWMVSLWELYRDDDSQAAKQKKE